MKKFLVLFCCLLFLSGCNKEKPSLFMSKQPISQKTLKTYERVFEKNEKIYYAIIVPKGFRDNLIRIQVLKKDEKSEFWGLKYVFERDFEIQNKYYYIDDFSLSEKGLYLIQVFEHSRFNKAPLIRDKFWIR